MLLTQLASARTRGDTKQQSSSLHIIAGLALERPASAVPRIPRLLPGCLDALVSSSTRDAAADAVASFIVAAASVRGAHDGMFLLRALERHLASGVGLRQAGAATAMARLLHLRPLALGAYGLREMLASAGALLGVGTGADVGHGTQGRDGARGGPVQGTAWGATSEARRAALAVLCNGARAVAGTEGWLRLRATELLGDKATHASHGGAFPDSSTTPSQMDSLVAGAERALRPAWEHAGWAAVTLCARGLQRASARLRGKRPARGLDPASAAAATGRRSGALATIRRRGSRSGTGALHAGASAGVGLESMGAGWGGGEDEDGFVTATSGSGSSGSDRIEGEGEGEAEGEVITGAGLGLSAGL